MVERVIELSAKLDGTLFMGPGDWHSLSNCQVQVCLARPVYHACSAVSECCPNAIRTDYRRGREAQCVEVMVKFRPDGPSGHELTFSAFARQVRAVFAYAKNVVGIGVGNGESGARLNRDHGSQISPP